MSEPFDWAGRRILVTGGAGFLGRAVCAALGARNADTVVAPSSTEFDLRDPGQVASMFADAQPDLVVHLAARVGGIGANQARPSELFVENLLMGTYVIEEARRRETPKTVLVGTVCSYPKEPPVPFKEESLWQGYPEETNAPYGIAKLAQLVHAQSNRAQYGQNCVYLIPTNLYGPGDKFHPAVSHVIPALGITATAPRADRGRRWPRSSTAIAFCAARSAPPRGSGRSMRVCTATSRARRSSPLRPTSSGRTAARNCAARAARI